MSYMPNMNMKWSFVKNQTDMTRLSMQKDEDKKDKEVDNAPKGFEKFFKKKAEEKKEAAKSDKKEEKTEKKEQEEE